MNLRDLAHLKCFCLSKRYSPSSEISGNDTVQTLLDDEEAV
jgi:hypothetical protein